MFSIIVPTYNNLDYLKLCLKSIKYNSIVNLNFVEIGFDYYENNS